MKIITGKTATEHVNSEDDRGLHAGLIGSGSYVLMTGTRFRATTESSNTIKIESGDLVHQGCHARIPYDDYDTVTIDNCTAGYRRKDLIVARYRKSAGIESMTLEVIKGAEASTDPVAPGYNTGNILEGASISDMPLYEVTSVNSGGNTQVSLTAKFTMLGRTLGELPALWTSVGDLQSEFNSYKTSTNEAILSAQSTGEGAYSRANDAYALAENAMNKAGDNKGYIDSIKDVLTGDVCAYLNLGSQQAGNAATLEELATVVSQTFSNIKSTLETLNS